MSYRSRRWLGSMVAGLWLAAGWPVAADGIYDEGATDTEIRIGNTNPYSGPASSYGTIGKTLSAYFDMVNARGGINGRKITFLSYDDGFNAAKTVEHTRRLVEQEKVLFMFQTLGTPNYAIHKYLNDRGIPQLFIADGSKFWAQPDKYPWSIGWQTSFWGEGRIYARYLLQNHPDAKVGILYQNDNFGKEYVDGFRDGLGDRAEEMIVAAEPYEYTDPTIDSQIVQLKATGADTFLNISMPKFAAQAIRKVYDIGWRPLQLMTNVSSSIEQVMIPPGIEKSMGVITTIALKDPTDPQWFDDQDFKDYVTFMEEWYPGGEPRDLFNVYAYSVVTTLMHVLENAGDNLTRANIMKQAASIDNLELPMLMPGFIADTGPDDYFVFEVLQPAKFNGTTWEAFGPLISLYD